MKNLDLNAMGVVEINENEKSNVNGGQTDYWHAYLDGIEISASQMRLYLLANGIVTTWHEV